LNSQPLESLVNYTRTEWYRMNRAKINSRVCSNQTYQGENAIATPAFTIQSGNQQLNGSEIQVRIGRQNSSFKVTYVNKPIIHLYNYTIIQLKT